MAGAPGVGPGARDGLTMNASASRLEIDVRMARGDFSLDLKLSADCGVLALFGRSGSGKSTVLGLIAGLLRPDSGHIRLGGQTLVDASRGVFLPPHRRRIGFVFQDSLLFPHLDVRGNLQIGRAHV